MRWSLLALAACGRVGFDPHASDARVNIVDASEARGDVITPDGLGSSGGDAAAAIGCGSGCGPSQYCATPAGMCAGSGTCSEIPPAGGTSCSEVIVCGCDGMTYADDCAAAAAGVSVASSGAQCGAT